MNNASSGSLFNSYRFDKRNPPLSRINDERMVHAMSSLIEMEITVNLENDTVVKGVFHAFDPTSRGNNRAIDIAMTTKPVYGEVSSGRKQINGHPMIISGSEYHYISAHGINKTVFGAKTEVFATHFKKNQTNKFKTDSEITSNKEFKTNETLLEWRTTEPVNQTQLCELDNAEGAEWDQFETNNREYGVVSTYNEDLYTTPLNVGDVPESVRQRADALASEIENSGEHSYSRMESLLEDEDVAPQCNESTANPAHKPYKDLRRRDRTVQTAKTKAKSTSNQNQPLDKAGKTQPNHSDKQTTATSPENDVKPDLDDSNTSNLSSSKSKNVDKHYQQIGVNALNLEPASSRISTTRPTVINERKLAKYAVEHDKHSDNETVNGGTDEKCIPPNSQTTTHDDKDPKQAGETTTKKNFKFNPNASTFTPNSINESFVVSESINRIPAAPLANDSIPQAQLTSSPQKPEFREFPTMRQYQKLDMREFRRIDNKDFSDNPYDERWGTSSGLSYKDILGDISSLKLSNHNRHFRHNHHMVPHNKMPTVVLPQHNQLSYPAYQLGGLPVGMVPYGTQMAPQYYNGYRYNHQMMQNQVMNRRNSTGSNTHCYPAATNEIFVRRGSESRDDLNMRVPTSHDYDHMP